MVISLLLGIRGGLKPQTWTRGRGAKSTITADLVAFTRAKGLYGGVNLDGTVVHANVPWNDAYYNGSNVLPPDIIIRRTARSPKSGALLAEVANAAK
jgi:lipid-binding SYLF domain-containing protein